jgi:transposase
VSIVTCLRARIVLAAAEGAANAAIAGELGVGDDMVRKWRRRFCEEGLDGLGDRPRPGRPRRFAAAVVAEVKALACELAADTGVLLAKWSCPDLAAETARRGIVASVSASTVRRWLAADALKPWHRSWIFPRDPDFAVRATRVLDLYARIWEGLGLTDDRYVHSADKKPAGSPAAYPPQPPSPCGSPADAGGIGNTDDTAPSPTWPPMTGTAPTSSATARRAPGSSRSPPSSPR